MLYDVIRVGMVGAMIMQSYIADRRSKRIFQYAIQRRAEALIRQFRRFAFPSTSMVLDIGTADGLVLYPLASQYGFACIGVDVRYDHLQAAKENIRRLVQADGKYLPFQSGSVDAVVSTAVFKHIRGLERLVSECHRVLKPQGKLAVIDPTPLGLCLGLVLGHFSKDSISQILSARDIERLLVQHGFSMIAKERYMLSPVPFWGSDILEQGLASMGFDWLFLNQIICAERADSASSETAKRVSSNVSPVQRVS